MGEWSSLSQSPVPHHELSLYSTYHAAGHVLQLYLVGTFLINPKDKKSSKSNDIPSKVTVLPPDVNGTVSGVVPMANGKSAPRADGKIVCCVSVSTYVRPLLHPPVNSAYTLAMLRSSITQPNAPSLHRM